MFYTRAPHLTLVDLAKRGVIKWDKGQIENFLSHFVEITKVKEVTELKHRNITTAEWKELAQELNVPTHKVRVVWHETIHPRLFIEKTVHSRKIKKELIEFLIERGETDWRSVNWDEIAQNFEGFTGRKLSKILRSVIGYYVPPRLHHDLKECLRYIKDANLSKSFTSGLKIRRLKVVDERQEEL